MKEDFFVLTALPEEITPVLRHLSDIEDLERGFQRAKIANVHGVSRHVLLYPIGCGQGTNKANTIATEAYLQKRRSFWQPLRSKLVEHEPYLAIDRYLRSFALNLRPTCVWLGLLFCYLPRIESYVA